jgi:hypothetical protein
MFKTCCGDCGECWYVGNPRTCTCPDETPQRTWVELTDEEILEVWKENEKVYSMDRSRLLDRTRACIRKAQEK